LATRGTVTSDVPGSAAVVATVLTDPISSAVLSDGEVLEHAAVLEQVVAFWMDVAPGITFTFFLGSRRGLGLLRKRLGDEDPLVGSRVPLLVLGWSGLVLGFILPGELGSFFSSSAPICKLPELTSRLDAMDAQLLAHLGVADVGVEGLDHQLLLDARDGVHLLGEALDELAESFTRQLLEVVEITGSPRALVPALESPQKLLLQCPPGTDGALGKVEKPSLGISLQGQREPVGHHDLVGPGNHRSQRVDLQKVPGVRGAVVAENVDLEFLGPVEVAELGSEGEAAFGEVDAPIFPAVTFSATLDAGAHILVLTAVELVTKIWVARGRRPDGDGLAVIAV
jgi:hypothetical protein